mmetsp:Transcript_22371/g.62313  ORF Transcript_22371/g.62313 Transcript_22371/m.62313 type:complete len:265 (+) Transcript_22371:1634-2428(+)
MDCVLQSPLLSQSRVRTCFSNRPIFGSQSRSRSQSHQSPPPPSSAQVLRRVQTTSPNPHRTNPRSLHGRTRRKDQLVVSLGFLLRFWWLVWKQSSSADDSCLPRPPPSSRSRCLAHMSGGRTKARNVWETPPTNPLSKPKAGTKVAAPAAMQPRATHTAACVFRSTRTGTAPSFVSWVAMPMPMPMSMAVSPPLPSISKLPGVVFRLLQEDGGDACGSLLSNGMVTILADDGMGESPPLGSCRLRANTDHCCSRMPIDGRITTG